MDLIDRQSLIEKFQEKGKEFYDEGLFDSCYGISCAKTIAYFAPTIEPKRGEWIESSLSELTGNVWYECSECGALRKDIVGANFCHRCGADMRGKDI